MKTLVVLLLSLTVFISGCSSGSSSNNNANNNATTKAAETNWQAEFPAHWWKEVPRKEAKSWEVLPQDAGYMEVILSKRNELGILSNFAETSFVYHGVCYPSVEAFWQMMKYPETPEDSRWQWSTSWRWTREQVAGMNGYSAKAAGNYVNAMMDKNKANWATFEGQRFVLATSKPGQHYQLIWDVLLEKIRQNPEVLDILKSTKKLKLRPDHTVSERSPREWHFNLLWMDVRDMIDNGALDLQSKEDLSLKTCKGKDY